MTDGPDFDRDLRRFLDRVAERTRPVAWDRVMRSVATGAPRRRRLRIAVPTAAAGLVTAGALAGILTASLRAHGPSTSTAPAGSCDARVPVRVVAWTGERVHLGELPPGYRVTHGREDDLRSALTYGIPNDPTRRIEVTRDVTTTAASMMIIVKPATPVTVHGHPGVEGPGPTPDAPSGVTGTFLVAWHETPDIVLVLTSSGISSAQLLDLAEHLSYNSGQAGPEVDASPPGAPASCRILPHGAISREAAMRAAERVQGIRPAAVKLVRQRDVEAADPDLVPCPHVRCPDNLLIWVSLTPEEKIVGGPAPIPPATAIIGPGWLLHTFDASTGKDRGTSEQQRGAAPAYWTALNDYSP